MWILHILPVVALVVWHISSVSAVTLDATNLRSRLLKGYNSRVRPVKKESTITKVQVFLNIANVDKINEEEQTVVVHGHLWASWKDEYLQWDRKTENITKITIPAFKVWQPALSLYNSARGRSWHLYLGGMPATVYFNGKVWATGYFSFHVTCQFDFTNWPFDEQSCPIVIADWVYGLNQVNLSDPYMVEEYAKPTIRLSYDPMDEDKKLHVGGWEVKNAWKKHCYWGPEGCMEKEPTTMLEYYWSLLEFGVYLKRHKKYYQMTIVAPNILITMLTLSIFWIDACQLSIGIIMANLILQAYYGWYIFQQIAPGSGSTPKIVQLYTMNMLISIVQFMFVTYSNFLEERLPKDFAFNFGFDITELPKKIGIERLFAPKAISFDPQELLTVDPNEFSLDFGDGSTNTSIGIGNPLNDNGLGSFHGSATSSSITSENSVLIDVPSTSDKQPVLRESIETLDAQDENKSKITDQPGEERKLRQQFDHIKRFGFLITVISYIYAFLYVFCT